MAMTCSTSLVPMPKANAPNAPCVAVWLSPHTIVMPGWVRPQFRSDHVHHALVLVVEIVKPNAELLAVLTQRVDLFLGDRIDDRQRPVGGGYVVVGSGHGPLRPSHLAPGQTQTLERLGGWSPRGSVADRCTGLSDAPLPGGPHGRPRSFRTWFGARLRHRSWWGAFQQWSHLRTSHRLQRRLEDRLAVCWAYEAGKLHIIGHPSRVDDRWGTGLWGRSPSGSLARPQVSLDSWRTAVARVSNWSLSARPPRVGRGSPIDTHVVGRSPDRLTGPTRRVSLGSWRPSVARVSWSGDHATTRARERKPGIRPVQD